MNPVVYLPGGELTEEQRKQISRDMREAIDRILAKHDAWIRGEQIHTVEIHDTPAHKACDCGAEKARTPHVDWCSTVGA